VDGYAFVLNICRWHLEIRKTWTGCLFDSFGEESFKTNFIVYFVFVMVDCILCQNALIDLLFDELDLSCNLVKLLLALNKSLYR
jgi:hypothetical protein